MGRRKRVGDDELLRIAREAFVQKGVAVSTREIARRAGVSEAVIFQRHRTKEELFFAAMAPDALDVEALLAANSTETDTKARLISIATGMVEYFRDVVPVLLPLVTHPSFDFEAFAENHPEASLVRLRSMLIEYLNTESQKGNISRDHLLGAGLALFSSLFSLAVFEKIGVHGGEFSQAMIREMVESQWVGLMPRK